MSPFRRISVVLADQHPIYRQGIKAQLEEVDWIKILAELNSPRDILEQRQSLDSAVLIWGCNGPWFEEEGQQLSNLVAQGIRLLLLPERITPNQIGQLLEWGVQGCIPKDLGYYQLPEAIDALHEGKFFYDTWLGRECLNTLTNSILPLQTNQKTPHLTLREWQVLTCLTQGLSNQQTSVKLKISRRTAESHRSHLMSKLGIDNLVGLIRWAIDRQMMIV